MTDDGLELSGRASTAVGLQVQLYRCNGTNAQEFFITRFG